MAYSLAVTAVIRDPKGRLLMIHSPRRAAWEFPGGIVEQNETPAQAIIRETKEETGLNVEPIALRCAHFNVTHDRLILGFECKVASGRVTTSAESDAVAWMTMSEIETLTIRSSMRRRIEDLVSGLTFYRAYGSEPYEDIESVSG